MAPLNPVNPALFDKVAAALTYAKLYPLIQADFMGKLDCASVHAPGNMQLLGVAGPVPVTGTVLHTVNQGGSQKIAKGMIARYKLQVKTGDLDSIIEKVS